MKLSVDIHKEEFDSVVGTDIEVISTIFLNFPSDINGVYEFELMNSVINLDSFRDQMEEQGFQIKDSSLFVFGKMKIRIEGVKGADFKFIEGDYRIGRKQYHTWPYTLEKGDIVCMCGGNLSFLAGYYASVIIVAEGNHRVTLTFDTDEALPIDIFNKDSTTRAHSKVIEYEHTISPGKMFNFEIFQEYLSAGRKVIKNE
ncbi:hypothetical protein [Gorillibacterium sp. CAU 1737]|uniref:hypothetical protein n=1 Tax=Gorillibacterium sp. CAU 1737 TaxID=3140362 RepID=UPI003260AF20